MVIADNLNYESYNNINQYVCSLLEAISIIIHHFYKRDSTLEQ